MARQKELFHQFTCRRSPVVKSIKYLTVGGHNMNLVQTPSLGTPGMKKIEKEFRESEPWTTDKRIFFYVKTVPSNVDDESSIKDLRDLFGVKCVRIIVCYCQKSVESRRLMEDVDTRQYLFHIDASFETQIAQSRPLLAGLVQNEIQSPKAFQVGSDKLFYKSVPTSCPGEQQETLDIVSSVDVAETVPEQQETLDIVSSVDVAETVPEQQETLDIVSSVDVAETVPEQQETLDIVSSVDVAETVLRTAKICSKTRKISQEDWELLGRTLRHGTARSNHVRVNVVGNHGVGKTTLIKRLQQQEVRCPDPGHVSTENLEVHHLVARCVERNGEKVWEHDSSDSFLEELNIQRMAQAMIQTEKWFEPKRYVVQSSEGKNSPDPKDHFVQNVDLGSDFIDETHLESERDTCGQSTTPFDNLTRLEEKEDYLRKVLNCKEELETENQEMQYVSYWDFAGQATYYATHHLFMSPSAVYLVVIDLRKELDDEVTDNLEFRSGILQSCTVKEALKYWIQTVKAYTKDENGAHAPIIIVGTHKGEITDEGHYLSKFKEIRKLFRTNFECVAVENAVGPEKDQALRTLQNKIIDKGLGVVDKKVSTQWINLEYDMQLTIDKNMAKYLAFNEVLNLDQKMDLPMGNIDRLEAFLCHQHYKGKLLYYNHQDLKDLIITDPMMLVKYLNLLLRRTEQDAPSTHDWNEDGVLNQRYIQTIAKKVGADEYISMQMVKILVALNILYPLPFQNEDMYFLPCLLPDIPQDIHSKDDKCTRSSLFQISFSCDSIGQTTYHQIICALLKTVSPVEEENKKLIYNLLANFELDGNGLCRLKLYWKESKLYFHVEDFHQIPKRTMNEHVDEAINILENAIEEVLTTNQYGNVEYSFFVECPSHTGCFLSLDALKEHEEVLCLGTGQEQTRNRHSVAVSDIQSITKSQMKEEDPVIKQKPSDVVLGRLAWKLKMLGSKTSELALQLKMQMAFTKADVASRDFNDPGSDLLHILMSWRNQNKNKTTSELLRLLCKRDCFDRSYLEQALISPAKTDIRLDNIPDGAAVDNKDIVIISDHLSNGFTFVLIELGVRISEIDQERRNQMGKTKRMIKELLQRSRYKQQTDVTTRAILEAMRMLGLPLDPILMELNSLTSRRVAQCLQFTE